MLISLYLLLLPLVATESGTAPLVEKYVEQLKIGKPRRKKLKKIKEEILKADPENREGAQLKLALYKFEYLMEKEAPSEQALKPLKKYLKHFGSSDPEGAKNIELLITRYQEAQK